MKDIFDGFVQFIYSYNPCDQFKLVSDGTDAGLIAKEPKSEPDSASWGFSINATTGYMWLSELPIAKAVRFPLQRANLLARTESR